MRRVAIIAMAVLACSTSERESDREPLGDDPSCAVPGCDAVCEGPPVECVETCGGPSSAAVCDGGAWSCGAGVAADECMVCPGEPATCLSACGSDVEIGDAVCTGTTWTCAEGVLETSCAPCDGEEPLECVEACDEGDIYEAECIDDVWDCGDGELLEHCASDPSCPVDDPEMVCGSPCGADPWLCVPSCEVFEIYDAACVGEEWSCGEGVLAADC